MKNAAIWARVSSESQQDLSLDGQVERVKAKLESLGYVTQYIFKAVWTSTNLQPCPEFQQLRSLIRSRKIEVIGMLDRDRIEANGLQRLNFLADCRDNSVEPIVYQGVAFLEGGEGQLIELALALAKEKQVERASGGARQGLADRAKLKGLPPTTRQTYGYRWAGGRYVPDENYQNARLIWQLALSGTKLKTICEDLADRGVRTPNGRVFWHTSSIRAILTNSIYAGRVGTLKYERVNPKERRAATFGKTSVRIRPIEEWHFLEGLVESPVVSWQEFLAVHERLRLNRLYASRNARHDFLLRGLIQCQECYARGNDRHYYGLGRDRTYLCSAMWTQGLGQKCRSKRIPSTKIEEDIKARVRHFLQNPDVWHGEADKRRQADTTGEIERQLKDNERQRQKTVVDERQAFRALSSEAFAQEQSLLKARRTWLQGESARLEAALANMKKHDLKIDTIQRISDRLNANLDGATNKQWRFILETLNTRVLAFGDGTWDVEISIPTVEEGQRTEPIARDTPCSIPRAGRKGR